MDNFVEKAMNIAENATQPNEAQPNAINDGESGTAADKQAGGENQAETERKERTFSQDEVNAIIQKRIADEKERSRRELDEKERFSRLSIEEKEKAIQEREEKIRQMELKIETREILASKGLPKDFADILSYGDYNKLQESISILEKEFQKGISEAVEKRLRGKAPEGIRGMSRHMSEEERDAFEKGLSQ